MQDYRRFPFLGIFCLFSSSNVASAFDFCSVLIFRQRFMKEQRLHVIIPIGFEIFTTFVSKNKNSNVNQLKII